MRTSEAEGAAIYNALTLRGYDFGVLYLSNALAWRCPAGRVLALYDAHAADRHLDIGVGTGYFLDRCRFPTPRPKVTLLDLNPNSLRAAAGRVGRYRPRPLLASALAPLPLADGSFGSIGLSYLLHCLPGAMDEKARMFGELRRLLRPGGAVFGATILGVGVRHNALGAALMRLYNRKGVFHNARDDAGALEQALRRHFRESAVEIVGCVALFSGRA